MTEAEYKANISHLAEDAFDDQCTGANPRYEQDLVWGCSGGNRLMCLGGTTCPSLSKIILPPHFLPPHFRYPLISDLARILTEAYEAPILPLKNLEFFSDSAAKI